MHWSTLKLMLFDNLLAWLAGQLWGVAQDLVYLMAERTDLTGLEKLALARTMLLDRAQELGRSLPVSAANFLLEAAVQMLHSEMAERRPSAAP